MKNNYDDIIHLPHPEPKSHPRMSLLDRAAQFSPFAALTGHSEAIDETARLTDRKLELNEERKAELNRIWNYLQEHIKEMPEIKVTYFIPDIKKDGGFYTTVRGNLKKADAYRGNLRLTDGTEISLEDIYEIEIPEQA